MSLPANERLWTILVCAACGGRLAPASIGAVCTRCQVVYPRHAAGALDLRLPRPRRVSLEFELGTDLATESVSFAPLTSNPSPAVDFAGVRVPHHLSKELMSWFPRAEPGGLALDLGCGEPIHREACEHAGFEWVGVDYHSPCAPILADAHSLPFADGAFDFILSIAVLEHMRYPFVMIREASRVLKPGGRLLGTVAFLEPFHGDSFYHHTHLGALNMLRYGGLEVERIAPNPRWSGLTAQAGMALFPRMPRPLAQLLVRPVEWLHRSWWWAGGMAARRGGESMRLRSTTGAFAFVAVKR